MDIVFTIEGWEEFEYWLDNDREVEKKIRELLKKIKRTPFHGMGKPEPLKYNLKGFWSRRITGEHRLVYQVSGTKGKDKSVPLFNVGFITTNSKKRIFINQRFSYGITAF